MGPRIEYACYKGDEFIMVGTVREIAKRIGLAKTTVDFYATPSHKKRNPTTYILYKL